MSNHEEDHGHSIASWTGVFTLLIASTLLSIGIYFAIAWATWTGVVLVVVGIGAWVGLNAAGYGVQSPAEQKGIANHG
ncbi:hypothetical protein K0651_08845 [Ornithinimicrobium sp. Arc0846-15]|nr:hypothetical protein [Ornithinimicrobium laminariae]